MFSYFRKLHRRTQLRDLGSRRGELELPVPVHFVLRLRVTNLAQLLFFTAVCGSDVKVASSYRPGPQLGLLVFMLCEGVP